jgi:hypothetical protein
MTNIHENQPTSNAVKPFSRIRVAGVAIAIFQNVDKNGQLYYVADRPELSYKDEDGQWQNNARGYSSRQLQHLVKAAVLADSELAKLNYAARGPRPEDAE